MSRSASAPLLALLAAILLSSCFGGSGESSVIGDSSIQGAVQNFTGTVRVRGTGLIARPGGDGFFIFSGVPSGKQNLDFTQTIGSGLNAGQTATLAIEIPVDSKVDLGTFKVVGNRFQIGVAKVTPNNPEAVAAAAAAAAQAKSDAAASEDSTASSSDAADTDADDGTADQGSGDTPVSNTK